MGADRGGPQYCAVVYDSCNPRGWWRGGVEGEGSQGAHSIVYISVVYESCNYWGPQGGEGLGAERGSPLHSVYTSVAH